MMMDHCLVNGGGGSSDDYYSLNQLWGTSSLETKMESPKKKEREQQLPLLLDFESVYSSLYDK